MTDSPLEGLRPLFYPRSIAVVGASNNPFKLGFQSLLAVKSAGFEGPIYPINPHADEPIQELTAYPSLADIPGQVDLVVYAIPDTLVLPAVREAAAKGARAGVIFAGGFREVGAGGVKLQEELVAVAGSAGMKLIGPNCIGMLNARGKVNATFAAPLSWLPSGGFSMVSQSGGVGTSVLSLMADELVGASKFVSIGNRANVEFADLLDYLAEDDDTAVVGLFMEGVDDARRFLEAARRCAAKKPVVICSAGYSEKAARTSLSHTGSVASSEFIYTGAFRQAGLIHATSVQDLVCTGKALEMAGHLGGNGVFINTHTAGPAIVIADILEKAGVRIPALSADVRDSIASFIPTHAHSDNPLDMFAHAWTDGSLYLRSADLALAQDDIHCAVAIFASGMGAGPAFPAAEYAEIGRKHGKPVFLCLLGPTGLNQEMATAQAEGVCVYNTPEKLAHSLAHLTQWAVSRGERP